MNCRYCGNPVQDGIRTCPSCGAPVQGNQQQQTDQQQTPGPEQYTPQQESPVPPQYAQAAPIPEIRPVYKQLWFIILIVIFFPPIGIPLLWMFGKMGKNNKVLLSVVFGLLFLLVIIPKNSSEQAGLSDETAPPAKTAGLMLSTSKLAAGAADTGTVAPTSEPAPTPTPEPTPEPTPTPTPEPAFNPTAIKAIVKQGNGDDVIKVTFPDKWLYRCKATHAGKGNFVVYTTVNGDKNLQVNQIGKYDGSFYLQMTDFNATTVEVTANGAWTLTFEPLVYGGKMELSSAGSVVSDLFEVSGERIFEISHSGKSNFVVYMATSKGLDLVINEIGKYSGKKLIAMPNSEYGFWIVVADGKWSIKAAE